jgi:hypothetical protein
MKLVYLVKSLDGFLAYDTGHLIGHGSVRGTASVH